jgi:hypothetical protein
MQAVDWVELLKRVPEEEHGYLQLGVQNGMEISIQNILRVDGQYVLIRGRVGGTNDAGRVFCFPYPCLTYLKFTGQADRQRLMQIFGEISMYEEKPLVQEEPTPTEPQPEKAAEPAAAPPPVEAKTPLRDRLRARLSLSKSSDAKTRTN